MPTAILVDGTSADTPFAAAAATAAAAGKGAPSGGGGEMVAAIAAASGAIFMVSTGVVSVMLWRRKMGALQTKEDGACQLEAAAGEDGRPRRRSSAKVAV